MHLIDVRTGDLGHALYIVRRVRAGYHRRKLAHVVVQDPAVLRVRIGGEGADAPFDLFPGALDHPVKHLAARHDEGHLAAHLRDHGAEGDALGEVRAVDRLAGELNGEVVHAARAEVSDDIGQQVAHAHALAELAGDLDLHRLGHAEPAQTADVGRGHVGVADARRERADRAEQVHVAVGAEHHVAGLDEARLEQDVLADAVVDVKEVPDPLTLSELADDLLVVRDLLGVRRRLQVEGIGDLIRIPDLRSPAHLLFKLQHAVGAAEIARGRKIDMAPDAVADLDFMAAGAFHDLHDCCFSHHHSSFHIIAFIL